MTQLTYALTGPQPGEEDRFFVEALDAQRWRQTQGDDWDSLWCVGMPPAAVFRRVTGERRINHIPGNGCLTVKSALWRTLGELQARLAAAHGPDSPLVQRCRFLPRTYIMPEARAELLAAAAAEPERLWLQKPENSSRGRGIRLLGRVDEAPAEPGWIIQEYLADPDLIEGRKYVLRLYVLIRSVEPLRVYLYREGFAKLASRPYTLADRTDPFVHQTNPDINATNATAADPVVFIDLARYRAHLAASGRDPAPLFARLRDLVTITTLAGRETMRAETLSRGADPRGCYELLGLDCLVDAQLRPWLLECNLNPSLGVFAAPADGGEREAAIKRGIVRDLVGVVGLNAAPWPAGHGPGSHSGSHPETDPETDPSDSREQLPADNAHRLLAEADAELAAAGDFERLYPRADAAAYWPFLPYPRRADVRLAQALAQRQAGPGHAPTLPTLRPWRAREHLDESGLRLFDTARGTWRVANATAALIWLHAGRGLTPPAIAEELARLPDATEDAASTACFVTRSTPMPLPGGGLRGTGGPRG